MNRSKKFPRPYRRPSAPPHVPTAVSVIIPMYNAERYIADGLDSLLAQTFQNFEVIVVDDCSTDKSCAVVESYRERFGERLTLAHMATNTGSGTEPRNLGLALSRGEYLYFMDNDDLVMPTALEELYSLAKEYNADVVHCEKHFDIPFELCHSIESTKNFKPTSYPMRNKVFIKEPTLLTEDFAKRAVDFSRKWLQWNIWVQLVRRDFAIENRLKFSSIIFDDMFFTVCEICSAKRYLVVPNVIYIHRTRPDSLLWQDAVAVEKFIHSRLTIIKDSVQCLDEFLSSRQPFAGRPDLKYALFNMFVDEILGQLVRVYEKVPAPELDKLLRKEFSHADNEALMAFLFSTMNIYRLNLMKAQARIAELEAQVKRLQS